MEKRRDPSNGAGLRECACNALTRLRSRRPVEADPLGAGRPRTLLEFRIVLGVYDSDAIHLRDRTSSDMRLV